MRLHREQREQLPVMLDLAREIERQLDSPRFDQATPDLSLPLYQARHYAGRLSAFLDDLVYIIDLEHSSRRR